MKTTISLKKTISKTPKRSLVKNIDKDKAYKILIPIELDKVYFKEKFNRNLTLHYYIELISLKITQKKHCEK